MTKQSLAKRSDSFVRQSARLIPEDRKKEVPGTILLALLQRGSKLLPRDGTEGEKDGRVELIPQLSFLRSFVTPVTDRLEM